MEVKKHAIKPCAHHANYRFVSSCHDCLVTTVVRLCELLEDNPDLVQEDESALANGLTEVFAGVNVAHVTDHKITNVTALPMSPADLEEGVVRYTVEFRRDAPQVTLDPGYMEMRKKA